MVSEPAAIADALPGLVFAADPDGRVLWLNRTWREHTGLSVEDCAHSAGWLLALHPDDAPGARAVWNEAVRADEERSLEFRVRAITKGWASGDETYRRVLCRITPVRTDTALPTAKNRPARRARPVALPVPEPAACWCALCVDIEDQKRAELRLAANLEQQAHTANVLRRVLLGESRLDPIPENAAPDAASAPSLVIAPGLRVQADLEPAGGETEPAISGDFYDAFPLQDGQVALLVGDASGKGATAACRTAEIRHALRAYLHLSGSSSEAGGVTNPARAVGWLNDFLCAQRQTDTRPDQRITALVLIVLDPATGRLVCVAAGSEPPLIVRAAAGPNGQPGPVEVMDEAGLILGVDPDEEYHAVEAQLAPGDTLVLFTDGLTEARRGAEFLGHDAVAHLAQDAVARHGDAFDGVARTVFAAARAFAGGSLHDDACLLAARLDKTASR